MKHSLFPAFALAALVLALAPPARADIGISGLSGHWNTPSAEVLRDGEAEIGYNIIPKAWAWDNRGLYRNDVYFATLGFLPRVEVSARVTAIPGLIGFRPIDSLTTLEDADRMLSAKVQLVRGGRFPEISVGLEDFFGTRRFHTGYVVMGRSFAMRSTTIRLDVGYAGQVIRKSTRVTLSGAFVGMDLRPTPWLAFTGEYDTEKWNLGFKFHGPLGLTGRVAWLDARQLSVGAGLRLQL